MTKGRSGRRSIPIHSDNDGSPGAQQQPAADTPENPDTQTVEPGASQDPAARIAELEVALREAESKALRARADMQNYRRRVTEETAQRVRYAAESIMEDIIPVLDHFEMAVEAADITEATRAVCKGYEMILQQLRDVVARHGLTEVEAVEGMFFDPECHEAVERVPTADPCEGTVVRILRRGYRYHDRLLRPVQVAVAVQPSNDG